jgi:cytidylate kinase
MKIALDGPAGAGKSTVAKLIAKKLGFNYLDTGAMYRAVAYAFLSRNIDVNNHEAVTAGLPDVDLKVEYLDGKQLLFINGRDVTPFIRTPEVSKGASDVAVIPDVRIKLVGLQRQVADQYDIVMDGRDIGTYVLPDADFKFYITASAAVRAQRRYLEIHEVRPDITVGQIEKDIIARDATDSNREFAPLRQAEDAVLVDTTNLSIEEVVAQIMGAILSK